MKGKETLPYVNALADIRSALWRSSKATAPSIRDKSKGIPRRLQWIFNGNEDHAPHGICREPQEKILLQRAILTFVV